MPGPDRSVSYGALLRTPGVARPLTATTFVRLSYGAVGLALLLVVERATGSFAPAGMALGAFGAATILGPLKARAIDAVGRRRVLGLLGPAYAAVLLALAGAAAAGVRSPAVFVGLAAVAGLLTPLVGPVMRGVWAAVTPDPVVRRRAYSLDAVAEETCYAGGPVLAGVLVALGGPLTALVVTAVLALAGSLVLAFSTVGSAVTGMPAAPPSVRRDSPGPLASRELRWVLLLVAVLWVGLSPLEVAVAARATEAGTPAAAGWLLAALSVGSAVGGLLWGRSRRIGGRDGGHRGQLLGLTAALAVGMMAAAAAPTLGLLALVLLVTGLAVAPTFVVAYLAADRLTVVARRTEASTWVGTASNLGGSLGAVLAGLVVERASPGAALLTGGLVLVLALALLVVVVPVVRATRSARPGLRSPAP